MGRVYDVAAKAIAACALVAATGALTPAAAELRVTVTIKPVHALVARVMAGVGTPTLLVSGSTSPHAYAMRPSDARALHNSDVFFRVSEAVEPFTGRIVKSLPKSVRVVTLADAPGIELLSVRKGDAFESHGHDDEMGDDDEGGTHLDHDVTRYAGADGHVWLDPVNARKMVGEIARVLIEASPEDADALKKNAERLTADIDALEAEIAGDLEPVKGKPFVVFHDAYQYFERRFGLTVAGSITVSPEVPPSARRLTEIRRKIVRLDAACVFAEPQFQPRLVDAVIEGTKARSGTLDPEGALVTPGPDAYSTLMRSLAAGLKSCLLRDN